MPSCSAIASRILRTAPKSIAGTLRPVRRRSVRLGCAVLLFALIASADLAPACLRAEAKARHKHPSAAAFVDSVGVDLHLNYVDTAYSRQDAVVRLLGDLGVRHVQDSVPVKAPALERGLRAIARRGIGATLVTSLDIRPKSAVAAAKHVVGRRIDAVEGPSELDYFAPPNWSPRLRAYLPRLRAAIKKRGAHLPFVGPGFADVSNYRYFGGIRYDVTSLHSYPGGLAPEDPVVTAVRRTRAVAPRRRPVWLTETGYHNALASTSSQRPVSEGAAATYLPRELLAAFRSGIKRTFIYELLDEKPDPALLDQERHFGLVRYDLSPKPAFFAVRNLLASVRTSPGSASPAAPVPSVSTSAPIERVVLTRADGSRVVAIWRPVSVWNTQLRLPVNPGSVRVTVTWAKRVRDVAVVRPTLDKRPAMRVGSTTRLTLSLAGDAVLVSYH